MKRFVLDIETNGVGGFRPPQQRVMQLAYGVWSPGAPLELADVSSVRAPEVDANGRGGGYGRAPDGAMTDGTGRAPEPAVGRATQTAYRAGPPRDAG